MAAVPFSALGVGSLLVAGRLSHVGERGVPELAIASDMAGQFNRPGGRLDASDHFRAVRTLTLLIGLVAEEGSSRRSPFALHLGFGLAGFALHLGFGLAGFALHLGFGLALHLFRPPDLVLFDQPARGADLVEGHARRFEFGSADRANEHHEQVLLLNDPGHSLRLEKVLDLDH